MPQYKLFILYFYSVFHETRRQKLVDLIQEQRKLLQLGHFYFLTLSRRRSPGIIPITFDTGCHKTSQF